MATTRKMKKHVKLVAAPKQRFGGGLISGDSQDGHMERVADQLMKSPIVQRVPLTVRTRLDRLLFQRVVGKQRAHHIARKLQLNRYGINAEDVQRYRDVLEELIRPAASSQVIAGVLGCLPAKYRRQMMMGNQVLLLSKVAMALSHSDRRELEAGELMKLASVLRAAGLSRGRRPAEKSKGKNNLEFLDLESMTRGVRTLYGLTWPPPANKRD